MPTTLSYPGVYIEEIPSGVRTITGVATSITAFVGRTLLGPINEPITINGFADFERRFGGLWLGSPLGYAVRDFFINGGGQAILVRLFKPDEFELKERAAGADAVIAAADTGANAVGAATNGRTKTDAINADPGLRRIRKEAAEAIAAAGEAANTGTAQKADVLAAMKTQAAALAIGGPGTLSAGRLKFKASSPGTWAATLRASISALQPPPGVTSVAAFDLTVTDARPGGRTEKFLGLSTDSNSARRADHILETGSELVRFELTGTIEDFADLTVKQAAVGAARNAFNEARTAAEIRSAWSNGTAAVAAVPAVPATATSPAIPAVAAVAAVPPTAGLIFALGELWSLALDPVSTAERSLIETRAFARRLEALGDPAAAEKELVRAAENALADRLKEVAQQLSDGDVLDFSSFFPDGGAVDKRGMFALEKADLFNLLCIPPHVHEGSIEPALISEAIAYCERRRAMIIIDPPAGWNSKEAAKKGLAEEVGDASKNAAIYFPRLKQPDPMRDGKVSTFAPCGAVAGTFARTDTERGVWKAPAGLDTILKGVPQLSVPLTDPENGELNPLGINCLRSMPAAGRVVWGARTRVGNDRLASEWKYIPVRRLALFIEESLYRGTQWVVFEPNDEPLWAQIRLNIGAFMNGLFRQGAFQGKTPAEAYFVKVDKETTTQTDINLGIVNIVVGFAPLKPAEFVVIKLQQIAGEIPT